MRLVLAAVSGLRSRRPPREARGKPVADVEVEDDAIVVYVRRPGLIRGRRIIRIPFDRVTGVHADTEISSKAPGFSAAGHFSPRYIVGGFVPLSGTVYKAYYAVRRGMPAVVIDFYSDDFQRVIAEVARPEDLVAQLHAAIAARGHALLG